MIKKKFLFVLSFALVAASSCSLFESLVSEAKQLLTSEETSKNETSTIKEGSESVSSSSITGKSEKSSELSSVSIETGSNSETSSTDSSYIIDASTSGEESSVAFNGFNVESYYGGYYKNIVSWENGEDLRRQLNLRLHDGYTALKYEGNWVINQNADEDIYDLDSVNVVYSETNELKTSTNNGTKGWDREHAFCASLMTGSTTGNAVKYLGRATDFHNLFAAYSSGNRSRGNLGYGDISSVSGINYGSEGLKFEPGDNDKGRLARAIFYMCTMWMDDDFDTANNVNMKGLNVIEGDISYVQGNDCAFAMGNLSDLLSWNTNFAVDRQETRHNEGVYSTKLYGVAQGNRNPYVDYPGLVDYVFGSKKNQPGEMKFIVPSAELLGTKIASGFHNYAFSDTKRNYLVGENYSGENMTFYSVKNDFSRESIGQIQCQYPTHIFTDADIGEFNVNFWLNDVNLNYIVHVEGGEINSCSFQTKQLSSPGDLSPIGTSPKSGTTYSVALMNSNKSSSLQSAVFNILFSGNGSSAQKGSGDFGVQFGTSSSHFSSMTIETESSYENIDKIYILAAPASKKSVTYSIEIGNEIVANGSYTRVTGTSEPNLFGLELPVAKSGKIKITFSDIDAAFYLKQIAFNQKA